MCIEEFLTISNSPSNYAYLKALLFLSILSNFEENNIDFFKLTIIFKVCFGARKKMISISELGIQIGNISDEFK